MQDSRLYIDLNYVTNNTTKEVEYTLYIKVKNKKSKRIADSLIASFKVKNIEGTNFLISNGFLEGKIHEGQMMDTVRYLYNRAYPKESQEEKFLRECKDENPYLRWENINHEDQIFLAKQLFKTIDAIKCKKVSLMNFKIQIGRRNKLINNTLKAILLKYAL